MTGQIQMDILPEIIEVILDYVCDIRLYCQVSKLALEQSATRVAEWRQIRSLNDYFTRGSAEIIRWALANVPEFAALDTHGLVCALANAVRADNVDAISVLAPLVPVDLLPLAARYCSAKTYKMFDIEWSQDHLFYYCRCPFELGFSFNSAIDHMQFLGSGWLGHYQLIRNRNLTDEYLIAMLDDIYYDNMLEYAVLYNRTVFAVALVERYGPGILRRMLMWNGDKTHNLRLMTTLAQLDPATDYTETLERAKLKAINIGAVHQLDDEDEIRQAAKNLQLELDCARPAVALIYSNVIAKHCSDEAIEPKLLVEHDDRRGLWIALAKHGRVGLLDKLALKGFMVYSYCVHHVDSLRWAMKNGYQFKFEDFLGGKIELYLVWVKLVNS